MTRRRDPLTKDLFSWQPPVVAVGYGAEVTGRGRLDNKIARLIAHALRHARDEHRLTRPDVAGRMSEYLGRTVSPAMLDKWSSEGSEDHRISLDAFIALVDATGAQGLLGFVPGEFGLVVIEQEYAELIRLHLIREKIKEMQTQEQLLSARLRSGS